SLLFLDRGLLGAAGLLGGLGLACHQSLLNVPTLPSGWGHEPRPPILRRTTPPTLWGLTHTPGDQPREPPLRPPRPPLSGSRESARPPVLPEPTKLRLTLSAAEPKPFRD